MHGKFVKRGLERHAIVELHELQRNAGILRVLHQRLAPLRLLDLVQSAQQRFQVAEGVNEFRCGLDPYAAHAGNIVDGIARESLYFDDFRRRHAKPFDHFGSGEPLILHGIEQLDFAIDDKLHQILIRRHNGGARAGFAGRPRIGGDQIVGLESRLLDASDAEGARRGAHQRELRNKIIRRIGPVRFVLRIERVAERGFPGVENHRKMRRPVAVAQILQQFPEHVGEAGDRARRQAIGLARERRQGVIGAEQIARAVDEVEMVAFLEGRTGRAVQWRSAPARRTNLRSQ